MNDSEEQEVQKPPPIKWIRTNWNNQGEVCLIEDKVYFTSLKWLPSLEQYAVIRESMTLEEWEDIPEEERAATAVEPEKYKRRYRKVLDRKSTKRGKRLMKRSRA